MEGPLMTFVFHHGGKFKKDEGGYLYYEPDHTEVLMGVEADTLDVFFVRGYYVELGYAEARECWWKSPGVPLEYGLRRLATDDDLVAMVKDCRRNFNLINLYFEHGVSEPCVVDEQEEDVPKINPTQTKRHPSQPTKLPSHQKACSESTKASAEGSRLSQPSKLPSQSKKFSTQSTKEPSQPSKLPTQPTKQLMQPTKEPTKPTGPSLKPTGPSAKPTRPTTKPSRPSSQPTKKSHEPVQTLSQQRKAYSQPTKPTPTTAQPKGKAKVTTTTRAGRHVKAVEVEEDSDSHDSYESAEDSLYKPPRVLGDDESSSDSDDGVNSTRLNKKREVKEKHKPGKTRLAEKEIQTDDSSYEASESEDESDSIGHNKRSCAKKKKEDAEEQARQMQLQLALAKGPAPLQMTQTSTMKFNHILPLLPQSSHNLLWKSTNLEEANQCKIPNCLFKTFSDTHNTVATTTATDRNIISIFIALTSPSKLPNLHDTFSLHSS
ncbi:hypothetical protein Ahy_B06g084207 [Arachis hypogaea]|uniref:PB1-like domain-containing protein n=1 Tax=Arachis hypogaea TaxID=3818 RepID=A0A444YRD0_ARAHY|nr:hypothetical protein Ahy_B06g084207 [Arachis hypogaea]